MTMLTIEIANEAPEIGERLDKVITARCDGLSRTKIQQLIKDGRVLVNGTPGKAAYRIEGGEAIAVDYDPVEAVAPVIHPEALPLEVIYEDSSVVAINKAAGMVVHPAVGHYSGTLVNGILSRWPQTATVGEPGRAGIVHRLDKDTSGVILVAKTDPARRSLMNQFKKRLVKKRYLALVEGVPDTPTGEINAPIGRNPNQRKLMAVIRDGREAVTLYKVVQVYDGGRYSLLEITPRTGRTHQIRVHLAFIKHPVVGDTVYGRRKIKHKADLPLKQHFLHAQSLEFFAPGTRGKETIYVEAPLPDILQRVLDQLAAR
jgi:23S rRNA pseudouridine1911/1915/1917 synthase